MKRWDNGRHGAKKRRDSSPEIISQWYKLLLVVVFGIALCLKMKN
jgi:hypothetical protein